MNRKEALESLLDAHGGYYNVNRETPTEPFDAEATFLMHNERYFLLKSAKVSETDAGEHIFFATSSHLTAEELGTFVERAWEIGLERVEPGPNHKNTDVILYVLADETEEGIRKCVRKHKFYQGYKFGFHGYSHFKLVVHDLSNGTTHYNRLGEDRRKVIDHIFKESIT